MIDMVTITICSEYTKFVLEALELEDTVKNYDRRDSTGWFTPNLHFFFLIVYPLIFYFFHICLCGREGSNIPDCCYSNFIWIFSPKFHWLWEK
jgi:hypothetical protein